MVNHYNQQFKLNLTDAEKKDLVEFLKSLPEKTAWAGTSRRRQ